MELLRSKHTSRRSRHNTAATMSIRDFDITYGEALAPAVRFWGAEGGQEDGMGSRRGGECVGRMKRRLLIAIPILRCSISNVLLLSLCMCGTVLCLQGIRSNANACVF